MEKVLFDTDIGTDIDDALALAYLLCQPECDLLGVTTVSGDVTARAKLVSAVCKRAGRNLPIYPGCSDCIATPQIEPYVPQDQILSYFDHDTVFPQGEAIEFMRRTIRENPGEVTLIAVGPMTNIALLFLTDPEIPHLLKRLCLMCGRFGTFEEEKRPHADLLAFIPNPRTQTVLQGYTDMNSIVDPYATKIVYDAPVALHRSVGMDITRQVRLDPQVFRDTYRHPVLEPVKAMAELWFRESNNVSFHDPVPTASIFMPDGILTYRNVNVTVETTSPRLAGFVFYDEAPDGRHQVADTINPDGFLAHFRSVFEA